MRVAIVHYHLRTGGVTRVIQHAASALAQRGHKAVILTGSGPEDEKAIESPVVVDPVLGYRADYREGQGVILADGLERQAREALGSLPDVWHIHNHSLGKNPALAEAVHILAGRGHRLLLQPHDFAEDGRPSNYRSLLETVGEGHAARLTQILYPQAPTVHYAALNGRDRRLLKGAGIEDNRLHLLANPVALAGTEEADDAGAAREGRLFVYPTRAIRRKNLGEFLLWAAVGDKGDRFAVTLAPENPAARCIYDRWVAFSGELKLPVLFEAGVERSFVDVLREATAVVTTSVAEGFGLAFLEPWLVNRPLCGRNLPDITAEFSSAGVDLSSLYDRLEVPIEWIGMQVFRERISSSLRESWGQYGRVVTERDESRAVDGAVCDGRVDFGRLDEPLQEAVIRRLSASVEARNELRPPSLILKSASPPVAANRSAIQEGFNIDQYGTTLEGLYKALLDAPTRAVEELAPDAVLDQFLNPSTFSLLRT